MMEPADDRAARVRGRRKCLGSNTMARLDAIVLGAGIVGTSIALHLAKRGLAVGLVDRRAPGEETSYGNAGVMGGNTVFAPAFPSDPVALLRIAPQRAPEPNCHLSFLTPVPPWLMGFRAALRPQQSDRDRAAGASAVCARASRA